MTRHNYAAISLCVGAVLLADVAHAQTTDPDTFTETIIAQTQNVGRNLAGAGLFLLASLTFINVVWVFSRLVFGGADLNEIIAPLVKLILFTGLALLLIQNAGGIAGFVLESAGALSERASPGLSSKPTELFFSLLRVAGSQFISSVNPLSALVGAISGFLIIGFAAGIVAYIVIAIIEIHLVASIGIILLGFLGWDVTADIGRRFLYYALGSCLKLVTTFMIAGVLQDVAQTWADFSFTLNPLELLSFTDNVTDSLSIVGLVIMSFMMIGTIPNTVMSMVTGSSYSSSAESGLGVGKLAVAVAALAAVKVGGPAIAGAISGGGASGGAGIMSSAIGQAVSAGIGGGSSGGGGGKASPAVVAAVNKSMGADK